MVNPIRIDALPALTRDRAAQLPAMLAGAAGHLTVAEILALIQVGDIGNGILTNAKLASMAQARFKGRVSAGAGAPEDLTAAQLRDAAGVVGVIRWQVFTASGTYTPHTNMLYCEIEAVGGGGGGGGCAQSSAGTQGGAGGGGGATHTRKRASRADIGASQVVTIGALGSGGAAGNNNGGGGGATSVGILCTAPGGNGGGGAAANGPGAASAAGTAGTGDVSIIGQKGDTGLNALVVNINIQLGGRGGSPGGGLGIGASGSYVSTIGQSGTGYGAGGSGGASSNASAAAAGGNGTPGLVIIREFCSS